MTEREGIGRERVDPRYDPAFQRGFAGGVDRVRGDERAFARPGTGPVGPTLARPDQGVRRARRAAPPPQPVPTSPESAAPRLPSGEEAPRESAPEPAEKTSAASARPADAPLLRNPWLLALLLAGLAGSALGLVILYTGYSSPPASYYGDSDTPSPEWVQRQILYYAAIPLLGCLPFSLLLAIAVAAVCWPGRSRPDDVEEPESVTVEI